MLDVIKFGIRGPRLVGLRLVSGVVHRASGKFVKPHFSRVHLGSATLRQTFFQ